MKLIAGLGNPGPRYAQTRHNVGFAVIDCLARRWSWDASQYSPRFQAQYALGEHAGQRVLLLCPQTYMNLSGQSVQAARQFYKIDPADVLVIYDDLDLPLGRVRVRAGGSGGGHNGMTDVLRRLGTDQIARVRVGIGRPSVGSATPYVLGRFTPEELETVQQMIETAAAATECWLQQGIQTAMNTYNRKPDSGS